MDIQPHNRAALETPETFSAFWDMRVGVFDWGCSEGVIAISRTQGRAGGLAGHHLNKYRNAISS